MMTLKHIVLAVAAGSIPLVAFQAVGIGRPPSLPDQYLVQRQCKGIDDFLATQTANDPLRSLSEDGKTACGNYEQGILSRDEWVKTMLELQTKSGNNSRLFVPELSGLLPADLESYTLLLIPDDRWREDRLRSLRDSVWRAFDAFGRAIGEKRIAIWFLDNDGNVDTVRAKDYCDRFGLDYNGGPYVVTASKRPDLLKQGDQIVVIKLGEISTERIPAVLNVLQQDLRRGDAIREGTLRFEEVWQRVRTALDAQGGVLKGVLASLKFVVRGEI